MEQTVKEGHPFPLGASLKDGGVNFALFSKHAEAVELLLFDHPDIQPSQSIPLTHQTRYVWHGFVPGLKAGQLYAYRVYGPYQPEKGLRFNQHCILIDPYAKAITGKFKAGSFTYGYDRHSSEKDLSFNNNPINQPTPKCMVIDDTFDWGKDCPPNIPMQKMVIYEVHVKSFTAHPSSGVKYPGTYLGFIEKIPYLKDLGITAVELLPIHHAQDEEFLLDKGLCNYWGYSTLGFFAPDSRFSTQSFPGCQVQEFKQLVKALHQAGIEVILDVVYNHTCEGNELGPTLSLKGIDNPTYYALAKNQRYYMDFTGCGNVLNVNDPQVLELVMDSLRYWVEEMHVDGFRFDLASTLGRQADGFNTLSSFFNAIHQDPILNKIKLIAEPWDTGWDGYKAGNFPVDWAEWNGKYRDCVRKFVKGDPGMVPEMQLCLTGSPDLYQKSGRTPYHSINFVTSHDGFTLYDLVSYTAKHNAANLENNSDGNNENYSWNWGEEGPTNNPEISTLRQQLTRNFFAILFLSEGVPMLLGGDEFLRTQKGNNNAYCQDNELNYFDWELANKNQEMLKFVKILIKFREAHPHFLCRSFFSEEDSDRDQLKDINWFDQNLSELNTNDPNLRSFAYLIEGHELKDNVSKKDLDVMVILNAFWESLTYRARQPKPGEARFLVMDTANPKSFARLPVKFTDKKTNYTLQPRSMALFVRREKKRRATT